MADAQRCFEGRAACGESISKAGFGVCWIGERVGHGNRMFRVRARSSWRPRQGLLSLRQKQRVPKLRAHRLLSIHGRQPPVRKLRTQLDAERKINQRGDRRRRNKVTNEQAPQEKTSEHIAPSALNAGLGNGLPQPPPPQPGIWTLIGPNGQRYKADTPLNCAAKEQRERIPADVALARVRAAVADDTPFDQATCQVGGGKCDCTNHCKQLD